MSQPEVERPAPSRVLSVLALVALACWSLATVVEGVFDVVNAVHSVSATRVLHEAPWDLPESTFPMRLYEGAFVTWILSYNAVILGVVLGICGAAIVHGSWRRCLVFALVAVTGPVSALAISQVNAHEFDPSSYLPMVAPGLGMVAIAVVTLLAAWLVLGVGTRPRLPMRS